MPLLTPSDHQATLQTEYRPTTTTKLTLLIQSLCRRHQTTRTNTNTTEHASICRWYHSHPSKRTTFYKNLLFKVKKESEKPPFLLKINNSQPTTERLATNSNRKTLHIWESIRQDTQLHRQPTSVLSRAPNSHHHRQIWQAKNSIVLLQENTNDLWHCKNNKPFNGKVKQHLSFQPKSNLKI